MDTVIINGEMSAEERQYFENYIQEKYRHLDIERLYLTLNGDFVDISVELKIQMLTKMGGELIGNPLKWNRAKQAEYFDTIPNKL